MTHWIKMLLVLMIDIARTFVVYYNSSASFVSKGAHSATCWYFPR